MISTGLYKFGFLNGETEYYKFPWWSLYIFLIIVTSIQMTVHVNAHHWWEHGFGTGFLVRRQLQINIGLHVVLSPWFLLIMALSICKHKLFHPKTCQYSFFLKIIPVYIMYPFLPLMTHFAVFLLNCYLLLENHNN